VDFWEILNRRPEWESKATLFIRSLLGLHTTKEKNQEFQRLLDSNDLLFEL